ncbi:hypothetical protein EFM10_02830 [Lactobacillus helveticus]|nr:hypothetical protein [Lactobacillus helveticus]
MYANLGALAFLIAACYMTCCWDHRLNPNLKFKTSSNWSYLVLIVLIIFVIWDILWNICSGAMSRFISQAFLQSSFRFAWKPVFDAISTGVSEETFRYLSIVTLLECLKETKHQVTFVVIIRAMIFGAFHLLNVMDEPFIAAIFALVRANKMRKQLKTQNKPLISSWQVIATYAIVIAAAIMGLCAIL